MLTYVVPSVTRRQFYALFVLCTVIFLAACDHTPPTYQSSLNTLALGNNFAI